ncbi:MAG: hypothetical protein IRZ04_02625 [Rhodospirillales bacterium]|nr:hypothetical protein [Rhodospirillales bacterium]
MRYAAFLLAPAFAASALAQPSCDVRLAEIRKAVAETQMPTSKEAQIKALLEQIERACRDNDEVVAQAGIDQIQAILEDQKRQRS